MDMANIFNETNLTQIIVILLLAVNGFFLVRHFASSDRLSETINRLNTTVGVLASELKTLQESDRNKSRIMQKLMSKIIKVQQALIELRSDFTTCKAVNCPNNKEEQK